METNLTLVCYDVADARRLRHVARLMKGFGERVQKSVFECVLGRAELERLLSQVEAECDLEEDSVRIYTICAKCARAFSGAGPTPKPRRERGYDVV